VENIGSCGTRFLREMRNGEARPVYMTKLSRVVSYEEAIRCRSPETGGSGAICFSSPSTYRLPWDQRARFSRIRAGVKLAAPSKTVNNVIRNSVQFSSLRSSRKVALGGTRTLHWMLHAIFNLSRISIKDAFVASYIAFKQLIARFWWIIWEK